MSSNILWTKTERRVSDDVTTNVYSGRTGNGYIDIQIESRKRSIAHANNRPGTWKYTSFFVVSAGKELAEKQTMKAAKEFAQDFFTKAKANTVGEKNE